MTLVIERYASKEGIKASIAIDKDYTALKLSVYEPIDGGPFATTLFQGYYTTKKSARQALKRFATDWKREE